MSPAADKGALAFAEKLLGLLGEGSFTATYKYAVLLALTDLCLEGSTKTGSAPTSLTTTQLAAKIIELYWPHTRPFKAPKGAIVLRQNSGGQAAILNRIDRFRLNDCGDPTGSLTRSRLAHPRPYARMLRDVEWTLVLMPLPKLQRLGNGVHPFIYEITWDDGIKKSFFNSTAFDNVIRLQQDVGDHLVRLAGLVRPLVQREWATLIARFNGLQITDLDDFLFGARRVSLAPLRPALLEVQSGKCFYCASRISRAAEVDHFVPWARYPDNGLGNLVVAHPKCNNAKSDHLASAAHVDAWVERSVHLAGDLEAIAQKHHWDWNADRSISVARSIYLRLPKDAQLWQNAQQFVPADRSRLVKAFA